MTERQLALALGGQTIGCKHRLLCLCLHIPMKKHAQSRTQPHNHTYVQSYVRTSTHRYTYTDVVTQPCTPPQSAQRYTNNVTTTIPSRTRSQTEIAKACTQVVSPAHCSALTSHSLARPSAVLLSLSPSPSSASTGRRARGRPTPAARPRYRSQSYSR